MGERHSDANRDGKWHCRRTPSAGSVSAYLAQYPWSNWSVYTDCWDATFLVEDFDAERIRLVLATDSD